MESVGIVVDEGELDKLFADLGNVADIDAAIADGAEKLKVMPSGKFQ